MDVSQVLMSAQSPDPAQRQGAEQMLKQAEETNFTFLMQLLGNELINETKDVNARQLAGLTMKNCLTAKDDRVANDKAQRWLAIDPAQRQELKTNAKNALGGAQQQIRHTAAQLVSAIALIELPVNQWPELVQDLTGAVVAETGPETLKEAILETIGFICEEINPDDLDEHSNAIVTAVVKGMGSTAPSVRLKATQAMYNTMEFVKKNMTNEVERHYIMQTLCETTQVENINIQTAAYEAIVRVAELYYEHLPPYMQALFGLTTELIRKSTAEHANDDEIDALGQQGIEFWTTICEEEAEIIDNARDQGVEPALCHRFVDGAAEHLVPLLLEALCLQDPDDDPDDGNWNMAHAAAVCLSKVSMTIEDKIVALVKPFMERHIVDADWKRKEAATLAFGSIMEGPSSEALAPFFPQGLDVLIQHMNDPSLHVKDTAAWAIGRLFEYHVKHITPAQLDTMFHPVQPGEAPEREGVLLRGLRDDSRVANNVCVALHNLCEQCEDLKDHPTNPLSPLFVGLATALLQCTERPDAMSNHLRVASYEALNTLITSSAVDTREHIKQILPLIITRLEQSFSMEVVSNEDREAQTEVQGLLCGVLQGIICKLEEDAKPFCDKMMALFLQVFGSKNQTVHEEALMAVAAIANLTETDFERYMQHFRPFLSMGLSNSQEHQVCQVAVGVVGDICRALEGNMEPYCEEIVPLLLALLQDPALQRDVKPPILSCFGDIGLALGGGFEKYLEVTMIMLGQAQGMVVHDKSNQDMLEYVDKLREGILEAFTGILQGLRAGDKGGSFMNYVEKTLEFLHQIATEVQNKGDSDSPSDEVLRAAVGVIGDLALALGPRFKTMSKQEPHKAVLKTLIKEARKSSNDQTKQIAQWVAQSIA